MLIEDIILDIILKKLQRNLLDFSKELKVLI